MWTIDDVLYVAVEEEYTEVVLEGEEEEGGGDLLAFLRQPPRKNATGFMM